MEDTTPPSAESPGLVQNSSSDRVAARGELKYRQLFESLIDGFALHEIVLDDTGVPVDYIFLEANQAFGKMTGLKPDEIIGKRVTEVLPGIESDPADWIGTYGRVALTGEPRRFEQRAENLGRWYSVSAYRPAPGQFATVFEDITDRKAAEEKISRAFALADGINRILHAAMTSQTEEELAESCLAVAEEMTGSAFGFIGEVAHDGLLYDIAISNPGWERCKLGARTGHRTPPGGFQITGLYGRVLTDGRSLFTNDPSNHPDSTGTPPGHPALTAFLGSPLVSEGRTVGIVALGNRPEGYSEHHRETLDRLAPAIVEAFQRLRAEMELQETALLADRLNVIEDALHSSLRTGEIIRQALSIGAQALGADTCAVTRFENGAFRVTHAYGFPTDIIGTVLSPEKERHSTLAMQLKSPVFVENAQEDERVDREHLSSYGVAAVAVLPLVISDEAIGNLYYNFSEPRRFSAPEIEFVKRLATSISLAMENARLFEEGVRRGAYSDALNRINRALHSSLEFDQIMRRVVRETGEALELDAAMIMLPVGRGLWEVAYTHGLPSDSKHLRVTDEESPLGVRAIRAGDPVLTSDVLSDVSLGESVLRRWNIASAAAIPLSVRDETLGVLYVGRVGAPGGFDRQQIDLLRKIAATLSLSLANAQAYQSEHAVAQTLQEAMLTTPEEIPGIDFSTAYRAASETALIGGDFLDIFEIGSDLVGMMVGDVAGKGLRAAALTSLAKTAIRVHADEKGAAPGRILTLVNRVVLEDAPVEAFVTVFFGVLSRSSGRLVYSSAAHTTAMIAGSDGVVRELPPTGPILGAFSGALFGDRDLLLAPGDALIAYTDGLTEARSEGDLFGEERLMDLLSRNPGRPPGEVVDSIMAAVQDFSHGTLRDDLALLAVQRLSETEAEIE